MWHISFNFHEGKFTESSDFTPWKVRKDTTCSGVKLWQVYLLWQHVQTKNDRCPESILLSPRNWTFHLGVWREIAIQTREAKVCSWQIAGDQIWALQCPGLHGDDKSMHTASTCHRLTCRWPDLGPAVPWSTVDHKLVTSNLEPSESRWRFTDSRLLAASLWTGVGESSSWFTANSIYKLAAHKSWRRWDDVKFLCNGLGNFNFYTRPLQRNLTIWRSHDLSVASCNEMTYGWQVSISLSHMEVTRPVASLQK